MKNTSIFRFFGFALAILTATTTSYGQCDNQVTQLSGSVEIGCVNVLVSSAGSVGNVGILCPLITPYAYWIGGSLGGPITGNGSYTFVFNPPVNAVSLDISTLDNSQFAGEEVNIEVNGLPYFVTTPGVSNGCESLAEISPTGTIMGCFGCSGSGWKDMPIDGPISSLKIINTHLYGMPSGSLFALYICPDCCTTNAGVLASPPIIICADKTAKVQPVTQTYFETDDILEYILFSDPGDTLGSIVATNDTAIFNFNPATMQTDVPYYIAAIIGDAQNNNVDLNDPCIDISNAIQVIWRPLPTVTFTAANEEICENGCKTIVANFTGTPPFQLKYKSGPSGIITQNFPDFTGTIQVCPPAGTPLGDFEVQAVSVKDNFCMCQ